MAGKEYTIRQAVKDALERIPCGSDFHGYDFLNECRYNLMVHGSQAKPYDSTLLRDMRRFKLAYGITVKNQSKSIYHKADRQRELPL